MLWNYNEVPLDVRSIFPFPVSIITPPRLGSTKELLIMTGYCLSQKFVNVLFTSNTATSVFVESALYKPWI